MSQNKLKTIKINIEFHATFKKSANILVKNCKNDNKIKADIWEAISLDSNVSHRDAPAHSNEK